MISSCQKISSILAIIFLLILIMVSTSSGIVLTKILFPPGRKSVCIGRMKDIDKYVSAIRKSCFHFKKYLKKNEKIGVH